MHASKRDEYGNPTPKQILHECRQPIVLALCPAVLHADVLSLDEPRLLQAPMECRVNPALTGPAVHEAYTGSFVSCACARSGGAAVATASKARKPRRLIRLPRRRVRGAW